MAFTRRVILGASLALPAMAWTRASAVPIPKILSTPDGRSVAIYSWMSSGRRRGVILFSHGAASSPWKYPAMVEAWAGAGYEVHAPLHVDSLDHRNRAAFTGLEGWAARIEDMRAASAWIGWPYVAVGHSYGALTALVMGGAEADKPSEIAGPLRDPRARCCVAFSPPGPLPPLITAAGYSTLAVPALITTGTHDLLPTRLNDPESWRAHLTAFDRAASGGHRYAAIFEGADHYFGGAICDDKKPGPPQTKQLHDAIAVSLIFMRAFGSVESSAGATVLSALRTQSGTKVLAK